jgi:hydrogenase maturation protein HypF
MGRLFDGVAALLGSYPVASFEGQAAIALESLVLQNDNPNLLEDSTIEPECYSFTLEREAGNNWQIDWQPVIQSILEDLINSEDQSKIARKFHHSLVKLIQQMSQMLHLKTIVLGGGCFQNAYLLTKTIQTLNSENIKVAWPQQIPVNDGGIALGQILATQLMP